MTRSRYHWCACCGARVITYTKVPMCLPCRKLARLRTCPLCGDKFDPYSGPSRRTYPTCPDCRKIYQRSRADAWFPLLEVT